MIPYTGRVAYATIDYVSDGFKSQSEYVLKQVRTVMLYAMALFLIACASSFYADYKVEESLTDLKARIEVLEKAAEK